ncbi:MULTISPECIES: hypothetical protein [unclassified Methylobacterium]|jgi:toxin ParE1/3/4|uniref:hypothetical protein n=1 Tax=unclassified Methylobacterium TaxID=2615210 RepID=UPI0013525B3D|nr:hypothetical protein [Methylobacterium sp. 2A]MWV25691.1 hypothetical protein [Methylobacterium sp. 2A]
MIYRTSPRADEDIAEAYVAGALRFGEAQAERYQDGLSDAFRRAVIADRCAATHRPRSAIPDDVPDRRLNP